jgi:GDPmannose 4,6-dehydratase
VEVAFAEIGRTIEWRGKGIDEQGLDTATGEQLIAIDPRYFRPTEINRLLGDPSKAREKLGWRHKTPFAQLVGEMISSDLDAMKRDTKIRGD